MLIYSSNSISKQSQTLSSFDFKSKPIPTVPIGRNRASTLVLYQTGSYELGKSIWDLCLLTLLLSKTVLLYSIYGSTEISAGLSSKTNSSKQTDMQMS